MNEIKSAISKGHTVTHNTTHRVIEKSRDLYIVTHCGDQLYSGDDYWEALRVWKDEQ